jgi:prephenate dehydrogenase
MEKALEMRSQTMKTPSIGIIGFGRFGRVIHRLFSDGFDILVSSSSFTNGDFDGVRFDTLENVVRGSHAIFLTVPINKVGATAERIRPYLTPNQVVVDVCSVKEHPNRELTAVLQDIDATIWPTHPMFGPDSTQTGFEGLVWVTSEDNLDSSVIAPYLGHLDAKGLRLVRLSCEAHDREAARTQGLTHFIGRVLNELAIHPSDIDTLGYKRLRAVRDQTCNDTWELFCDLQYFNRFSRAIHRELLDAVLKVHACFLDATPQRTEPLIGMVASEKPDADIALTTYLSTPGNRARLFPNSAATHCVALCEDVMDVLEKLSIGDLDAGLFCVQKEGGEPNSAAFDAMGRHSFAAVGFVTLVGKGVFVVVSRRRCQEEEGDQ